METATASSLARRLMNDHGLYDWSFRFDRAKRRFGRCSFSTQTITLSAPLVALNSEDRVRNTILHEIAHALVGPGHGHDYVWRMKARSIGCDGQRCAAGEDIVVPSAAWQGVCPSCGKTSERHRLTDKARRTACGSCCKKYNRGRYDPRFVFVWRRSSVAA